MADAAEEVGETARAGDNTEVIPVVVDKATDPDDGPTWASRGRRLGRAVVHRLPRISVAVAAGLLLCVRFPPLGWWYTALLAFALLAWVLTRESTTLPGGLG